jgi:hypothetical protein
MARGKRNATLLIVQARNPNWATTGTMTLDQAVVARHALRRQGLSAHIHYNGDAGSFVHYGMVQWQSKFAVTSGPVANALVTKYRANGLQARVVTRVFRS